MKRSDFQRDLTWFMIAVSSLVLCIHLPEAEGIKPRIVLRGPLSRSRLDLSGVSMLRHIRLSILCPCLVRSQRRSFYVALYCYASISDNLRFATHYSQEGRLIDRSCGLNGKAYEFGSDPLIHSASKSLMLREGRCLSNSLYIPW